MLEHIPSIIGESLQGVRAGMDRIVSLRPERVDCPTILTVASTAFTDGGGLDARFTADGPGRAPPLAWEGAPAGTAATVIVVEDADSPTPEPILHLIAWRAGGDGEAAEGAFGPQSDDARLGRNSFGKRGWLPPDPPAGHGRHRYVFQVFAVDAWPQPGEHPMDKKALLEALDGHILAVGRTVGVYARG